MVTNARFNATLYEFYWAEWDETLPVWAPH